MGCFSPSQPGNLNYGRILDQTLTTQVGLEPFLLGAEEQYSPDQLNLTLGNLNNLVFGAPATSLTVPTYAGKTAPRGFTGQLIAPTPGVNYGGGVTPGTPSPAGGAGGPASPNVRTPANYLNFQPPGSTPGAPGGTGGGPVVSRYGTQTTSEPAQSGLLDMMTRLNTATRTANVNDLQNLGPQAQQALATANPQMAGIISQLNDAAKSELAAGSSLTPDEQQLVDQQTRAAWAANGLGGTNASAANEVLNNYARGQQLQAQRQNFAQNVVGVDQSVYQNPILALLAGTGGAGTAGQAEGLLPGAMFNPESPFAGNIAAGNQQMAALFADPSTLSKINMTGQTASNTIGSIASIAGAIGGI